MSATSSVYAYSPKQARVLRLYDEYRTALMNAKYYGENVSQLKFWALIIDIALVLGTSSAFAGLAVWRNPAGANIWSVILACSALAAALRPILKMTDKLDRCAKLQYGYLEIYYRIQSLTGDIRQAGEVTHELEARATEIEDRFRGLELEGDAYQNPKKLLKAQEEVERAFPLRAFGFPREHSHSWLGSIPLNHRLQVGQILQEADRPLVRGLSLRHLPRVIRPLTLQSAQIRNSATRLTRLLPV